MSPLVPPSLVFTPSAPVRPAPDSCRPRWSRRALALVLAAAGALAGGRGAAQDYTFTTFAGIGNISGSSDGTGGGLGLPLFGQPIGVVLNRDGNLYVTDSGNQLIRVVTPAGKVTTFAGTVGVAGGADGTGTAASFNSPQGPAVDAEGNLYVAEYGNHTIRKLTPAGVVTTLAGTAGTAGTADGTGSAARFTNPSGVGVDAAGNVYVADTGNHVIRKITPAGVVTTLAGSAGTTGSIDGTGTAARFNYPRAVAVDAGGTVYVADAINNTIRKVTADGVVTTLAGMWSAYGGTDGNGTAARFNFPNGLTLDAAGNLYVADQKNHTIRRITPAGDVTTLAGLASAGAGRADGTGVAARFNTPSGVAADAAGNVYVADYNNQLIRRVSAAGVVTTVAGAGGTKGARDGAGYAVSPALFFNPIATATDAGGNVYVADTGNHTVRRIAPTGETVTLAGAAGVAGSADGAGTSARFNSPAGVAVDAGGNVYVADTGNHTVRRIAASGVVTTLAGTAGLPGSADGAGGAARFNAPSGVAVDGAGNVYVADFANDTVRVITPGGAVATLAGRAGEPGSADGLGTAAQFNGPRALAVDGAGGVYVADTGNHTVRRIAPGGLVQTLAGTARGAGSVDGTGAAARFNAPGGIAVDAGGNVFVGDTNNHTLRRITAAGVVTTLGGKAGSAGNVDGTGAAARFDHPAGVAVDAAGRIYVADYRNHTLRRGVLAGSDGDGGSGGSGGGDGSGGGSGGDGGTGGDGSGGGTDDGDTTGTGFLLRPAGACTDGAGTLYVADTANNVIRKIASDGTVTVVAGTAGVAGSADATGAGASFNGPTGITLDSAGNLYVCDTGNATIRRITPAGVVTTFAGSAGSRGNVDGTGTAARFSMPVGLARDTSDNLFVADAVDCTIRRITSAGVVTTFAGTPRVPGERDGTGGEAQFNGPVGLAIDSGNILYVADTYNCTIRTITPGGVVATRAGSAGLSGAYDGTGEFALFNLPYGVSVDSAANVYVADTGNNCIRRVTPNGVVTTLSGIAGIAGRRNGPNATALFNQPQALVAAGSTAIYVLDTGNSILRLVGAASTSTVALTTGTTSGSTGSDTSSGGGALAAPFAAAAVLLLLARLAAGRPRGGAAGPGFFS
ncbi:MAG: hypothetical protein JNG83_02990 [Opitutaceae bacterium]|nr:hypothetical protein [Opitutaceae bacterium]